MTFSFPYPTNIDSTNHSGLDTDDHEQAHDILFGRANDYIDAKADFNVNPANSAPVNQTNLNAAFAAGGSAKVPVLLPAGTINVDPPVVWNTGHPMVQGHGQSTVLNFSSNTDDGIVLGNGGVGDTEHGMAGFARQFVVDCAVSRPGSPNGKAGVAWNGSNMSDLANLYVRDFDIGFDFRANPYGTSLYKCSARYNLNNVGFRQQLGSQGGNDITLLDCWFGGQFAAINMEGSAGGLTMVGGQIALPRSAGDNDEAAGLRIGKNYMTGATAKTANIRLLGVSFEAIQDAWAIRNFDSGSIDLTGVVYHDAANDLGWFKTSGGNFYYTSRGHELLDHASFVSPLAVVSGGVLIATEIQTRGNTTVGGGSVNMHTVEGVFGQSSIAATWLA